MTPDSFPSSLPHVFAEKLFYEDEAFNVISDPVDYMTYDEIYEEALIKASQMYFKALNLEDPREMLAVAEAFHHEATPLLLHFIMFLVRRESRQLSHAILPAAVYPLSLQ